MEVFVYIDASGLEELALGRDVAYWNLSTRTSEGQAPKNAILVGRLEFSLPDTTTATEAAVTYLKAELQRRRADAYQEEREIQQRLDNLLSLTYSAPLPQEVGDDIPF